MNYIPRFLYVYFNIYRSDVICLKVQRLERLKQSDSVNSWLNDPINKFLSLVSSLPTTFLSHSTWYPNCIISYLFQITLPSYQDKIFIDIYKLKIRQAWKINSNQFY